MAFVERVQAAAADAKPMPFANASRPALFKTMNCPLGRTRIAAMPRRSRASDRNPLSSWSRAGLNAANAPCLGAAAHSGVEGVVPLSQWRTAVARAKLELISEQRNTSAEPMPGFSVSRR